MRIADKRRWLDERCAVAPPCRVCAVWRCNYTCKACRGPRKPPPPPRFRRKQVNWSIGGPDERSYSRTVVGSGAPTSTRCATPIGLTRWARGGARDARNCPLRKKGLSSGSLVSSLTVSQQHLFLHYPLIPHSVSPGTGEEWGNGNANGAVRRAPLPRLVYTQVGVPGAYLDSSV